ncbi:hypothetical protein [Parabacteroides distasonis]
MGQISDGPVPDVMGAGPVPRALRLDAIRQAWTHASGSGTVRVG